MEREMGLGNVVFGKFTNYNIILRLFGAYCKKSEHRGLRGRIHPQDLNRRFYNSSKMELKLAYNIENFDLESSVNS